eukprot:358513-Chlamydomonas_euryale.AAC.4
MLVHLCEEGHGVDACFCAPAHGKPCMGMFGGHACMHGRSRVDELRAGPYHASVRQGVWQAPPDCTAHTSAVQA